MKPGLLRFVLASIVIFFHITSFIYIGTLAVYCFFILSGYWITFMYEKKYTKATQPLKVFYVSRILRLFPVFYLFTILALFFIYIYRPNNLDHLNSSFWFSNIFLLGYNKLHYKPIYPAWSLDIELQFYILCPLILVTTNKRLYRIVYLTTFLIITLLLTFVFPSTVLSGTVAIYLLYFIIGIAIYKDKISFSRRTELTFTFLFLIVLLLHYCVPQLNHLIKSSNYGRYFNQFSSFLLIPLISNSVLKRSDNRDRLLGDMSYVLYLSHWVWIIPYWFYIEGLSKTGRIPLTIVYLLITYGMAYLIYRYYDKPIDQMRRNWVEKELAKELGVRNH